MWTMVIADDEPIITRGIQKMIDWEKMGIEIVGICQDGNSALMEIAARQPDVAILDISMPGKTGIEILKELNYMGIATRVIFISGFQQFEYAVEALRLGAVNYLLKPVNKNDLVENVKSCLDMKGQEEAEEPETEAPVDYQSLIQLENARYVPAAACLMPTEPHSRAEQKLMEFAVYHALERRVQESGLGIVFYKNRRPCLVFKNHTTAELKELCRGLVQDVEEETNNRLGLVLGSEVVDMSGIPDSYQAALKVTDYFYFSSLIPSPVLVCGEKVFNASYAYQDLKEARQSLMEAAMEMDEEKIHREFGRYKRVAGCMAEGDKETAVFNLLTVIHALEERLEQMGISAEKMDSSAMIAKALDCVNYDGMCQVGYGFLLEFIHIMQEVLQKNEKKDIIRAKAYMEDHYMENLTLDVMARYVHMNASYFSSYFKRQTGQNFKEYLNQIRLRRALDLLLSTDMKSYEIADAVGFRDAKYLSELFQKAYGKTPMAYRKELRLR
ncbi:response regulator transcription factor [Enterocloster lavalensis]|uniref:response regulator transcription factor n=1 Tax=Enterocloster lavalensis TaxID=460384 RepID=UPI002664EF00|nr:response regulator [Enterocloster lavalensis]